MQVLILSPQYCVSGLRLISIFSLKSLHGIYPPRLLSVRIDLFETSTRCGPYFCTWKYISAAQHTEDTLSPHSFTAEKLQYFTGNIHLNSRVLAVAFVFNPLRHSASALPPILTQDTYISLTSAKMTKTNPTAAKTVGLCIVSYGFFAALIVAWRQYAFFYLSTPAREMFVNYGH